MRGTRWMWMMLLVGGAIAGIAGLLVFAGPQQGSAQEGPAQEAAAVAEAPRGAPVVLDRSVLRTPEEAAAMDAARPDPNPSRMRSKPFLPTMDFAAYAAAKAAAAAGVREVGPALEPDFPAALLLNFTGLTKQVSGGLFPPDTDGAISRTQYCQIVNSRFRCYNRFQLSDGPAGPSLQVVRNQSLAAFFGYEAQTLFDPRVLWDNVYQRWIVAAEAFPESNAVQRQFLATSEGSDATGAFRILNINVRALATVGSGRFWDFPMVGMDEDTIMVSANLFNGNNFLGSRLLFINKARAYLGIGGTLGCIFSGGVFNRGTIGVPIVLDLKNETFTAQTPNGSGVAILVGFRGTDRSCPVVTRLSTFGVGGYTVPANAAQPGTNRKIDTGDNRFSSPLTQVGNNLWGAHTVGPNARWRRFNIGAFLFQVASGNVPKVATSAFNPSIAANAANTIYLTWNESSANAVLRIAVGRKTLAAGAVERTFVVAGVANVGDFQADRNEVRNGDYSATRVDPINPTRAWSVNEFALSPDSPLPGEWASRIVQFGP